MEIRSLSGAGFETIHKAFSRAFADYEVQINKQQLQAMLSRRGYDATLSFAAFDGDEMVAFTLNGIGNFYGHPTAYDTGTGTLKEYRGQGLASKVFEHSIPYLKQHGIRQYLLEVLQHNTAAVSVYRKLGFEVTREFNCFVQRNEAVRNEVPLPDGYKIRQLGMGDFGPAPDFWDFRPSWQNSFESIRRVSAGFACPGVFIDGELAGYCVFEPLSGDITQLAVDKRYRRRGVGSMLLAEMLRLNRYDTIKLINAEISCNSISGFMKAKNIPVTATQFEMVKLL